MILSLRIERRSSSGLFFFTRGPRFSGRREMTAWLLSPTVFLWLLSAASEFASTASRVINQPTPIPSNRMKRPKSMLRFIMIKRLPTLEFALFMQKCESSFVEKLFDLLQGGEDRVGTWEVRAPRAWAERTRIPGEENGSHSDSVCRSDIV